MFDYESMRDGVKVAMMAVKSVGEGALYIDKL